MPIFHGVLYRHAADSGLTGCIFVRPPHVRRQFLDGKKSRRAPRQLDCDRPPEICYPCCRSELSAMFSVRTPKKFRPRERPTARALRLTCPLSASHLARWSAAVHALTTPAILSKNDDGIRGHDDSFNVLELRERGSARGDGPSCCERLATGHLIHREPFAAGAATTVDNVELRFRAHNAYEAELFFGPFI